VRTLKLFQAVSVFCFSVLFQWCADAWNKTKFLFRFSRPPAALFHCSFISDVRTSLKQNTETVSGLFQPRVEKYANEAETVSAIYFSFLRATAYMISALYAIARPGPSVRPSVCLSVCLSVRDWYIIEKRLKLGLWNFRLTVAPSL